MGKEEKVGHPAEYLQLLQTDLEAAQMLSEMELLPAQARENCKKVVESIARVIEIVKDSTIPESEKLIMLDEHIQEMHKLARIQDAFNKGGYNN